ncbi:CotS family spore coat protein [Paenibacillus chungangensis]|uniref:CotS family spore coat protein n=1 Tax=Paenibacillus chungangensis TaxID=696535 RepID=A0ABW3HNT6_9BACL
MEEYRIVPWDHLMNDESPGINLEQYVPPELEKLAWQVCKSYNMSVSEMTLITSKPDKGGAIWRIETNHGSRSLKVLHRTPQRSLFSVGAQEYVVKQGARVPALIPTKDGSNSLVAGGKLWIVTDWIDTLTPVAKIDLEGAMTLCHGLGEFHQWTKGYIPPSMAGRSSRIFKWDSQYQKIMAKIGWFRHIAKAYPETSASSHLLSVVDMFEEQAKTIYARFQNSAYKKMIGKGEAHWGLAHQDYGWSNGQMGPGGIWVIDLDGVAYDLPIRDLRKIITSTMDDMGAWDLAWIRGVIEAYHKANPLDRETFELLWIDMAFPNEFYKHTKEVVFEPVLFMNTELDVILDRVVATEANKWEVLRELEKDMAKYPSGDYSEEETPPSLPYAYRDYSRQADGAAPPDGGAPAMPTDHIDSDNQESADEKRVKKSKQVKKVKKLKQLERDVTDKAGKQEKRGKMDKGKKEKKTKKGMEGKRTKEEKPSKGLKPSKEAKQLKELKQSKEAKRAKKDKKKSVEAVQIIANPEKKSDRKTGSQKQKSVFDKRNQASPTGSQSSPQPTPHKRSQDNRSPSAIYRSKPAARKKQSKPLLRKSVKRAMRSHGGKGYISAFRTKQTTIGEVAL